MGEFDKDAGTTVPVHGFSELVVAVNFAERSRYGESVTGKQSLSLGFVEHGSNFGGMIHGGAVELGLPLMQQVFPSQIPLAGVANASFIEV